MTKSHLAKEITKKCPDFGSLYNILYSASAVLSFKVNYGARVGHEK